MATVAEGILAGAPKSVEKFSHDFSRTGFSYNEYFLKECYHTNSQTG
jgi:hypothetical protein